MNWIQGAVKHKGALHRALGVPEGKKIPSSKMAQARNSKNPRIRRMASLANTLSGFHPTVRRTAKRAAKR